mmetsp:Transcript_8125/g.14716  ORF Transcript_8125/g.14716 Transcript_8125/m.14716 type:complete len:188 (+) Transcript_8125:2127-2690(+)
MLGRGFLPSLASERTHALLEQERVNAFDFGHEQPELELEHGFEQTPFASLELAPHALELELELPESVPLEPESRVGNLMNSELPQTRVHRSVIDSHGSELDELVHSELDEEQRELGAVDAYRILALGATALEKQFHMAALAGTVASVESGSLRLEQNVPLDALMRSEHSSAVRLGVERVPELEAVQF